MDAKIKALLLGTIVATLALGLNSVFAQEEAQDEFVLDANQSIIVVLVGAFAGLLTAYQGYRTTKENWDTLKFFDGVIMAILGSVPLAIGSAITQTQLGVFEYVMIFFASLGIGVQIKYTRQPTVPSNAG